MVKTDPVPLGCKLILFGLTKMRTPLYVGLLTLLFSSLCPADAATVVDTPTPTAANAAALSEHIRHLSSLSRHHQNPAGLDQAAAYIKTQI